MSTYLLAQIFGFAGYFLYAVSPRFLTQERMIQLSAAGALLLCVHWYLMQESALLILCAMAVGVRAIALMRPKISKIQAYHVLLYPIGGLIIVGVCDLNTITLLSMLGYFAIIASSFSLDERSFRLWAMVVGGILCLASGLTGAIVAFAFGLFFTYGHAYKLVMPYLYTKDGLFSVQYIRKLS